MARQIVSIAACVLAAGRVASGFVTSLRPASRLLWTRSSQRVAPVGATPSEAILGLGCFWDPSEKLERLDGVLETACGYAGANATSVSSQPTYASVCRGDGNVECVKVTYDADRVALEDVLTAGFECAKPSLVNRQYSPVVFVADDADAQRVDAWRRRDLRRNDGFGSMMFAVERADRFFRAEPYHQRYWKRWRPRYAVAGAIMVAQLVVPGLVPPRLMDLGTVVLLGICGLGLWERTFASGVNEEPLITSKGSPTTMPASPATS